jgi:hypothetical protein
MHSWQLIVVLTVTVACVGYMAFTIARMLSRSTTGTATVRPSTSLEAGLVGAVPEAGEKAYDAFSYRTTARYAGRVRVVLRGDVLTVSGPRAPRSLYVLWIWLQGITLALVPPALVLAAVKLDWRALLLALGIMVVSSLIMAIGAGVWPGMGETMWVAENRFDAVDIPLSSISNVTLGEKWARDGLRLVIAPYAPGIDQIAKGRAVCFNAPDGEGRDSSYGLHMLTDDDAQELYRVLSEGAK